MWRMSVKYRVSYPINGKSAMLCMYVCIIDKKRIKSTDQLV